jgi:hypothetical protein
LSGPTDLAQLLPADLRKETDDKYLLEEPEKAIPERIYYSVLLRPTLIVYPLEAEDPSSSGGINESVASVTAQEYLVALKVAIPGDPTNPRNDEADVTYVINTVAQSSWLPEFDADEDETDLDE